MKIGIDLDGVCRNFDKASYEAFIQRYPHLSNRFMDKHIYKIDKRFPFEHTDIDGETFINQIAPKEIFGLAEPIEGSLEALNDISRAFSNTEHELFIVSHQNSEVQRYSWLWLYSNNIPISNTIFVSSKGKDKWNYVDIMVDDSPSVLDYKPDEKIAIKVKHPYNTASEADYEIENLSELLPVLRDILT